MAALAWKCELLSVAGIPVPGHPLHTSRLGRLVMVHVQGALPGPLGLRASTEVSDGGQVVALK